MENIENKGKTIPSLSRRYLDETILVVLLLFATWQLYNYWHPTEIPKTESFGTVEVRAYTAVNDRTATNKLVLPSDYSVAVSPDIEQWIGGISNQRIMHIPGYNKPGGWSIVNDRSDLKERSIEVLMTAGDADKRAKEWGVKKGKLLKVTTPAGVVYWVEFDK